jgi:hypothetical protein
VADERDALERTRSAIGQGAFRNTRPGDLPVPERLCGMVDAWDRSKRISRTIVKEDFIRAPDGSFVGE